MRYLKFFIVFSFFVLLNACSGDPAKEVSLLIKDLSSKESGVRNRACLKIGSYGSNAEKAVPHLVKLLYDPNNGVRTSAAFALRSIGGEKAQIALDDYKKE